MKPVRGLALDGVVADISGDDLDLRGRLALYCYLQLLDDVRRSVRRSGYGSESLARIAFDQADAFVEVRKEVGNG